MPSAAWHPTGPTLRGEPGEREVRLTVIRLITSHLQPTATHPWHGRDLDFTGAFFDGGDFRNAVFSGGTILFRDAEFSDGVVDFQQAMFSDGDVTTCSSATTWQSAHPTTGSPRSTRRMAERASRGWRSA